MINPVNADSSDRPHLSLGAGDFTRTVELSIERLLRHSNALVPLDFVT